MMIDNDGDHGYEDGGGGFDDDYDFDHGHAFQTEPTPYHSWVSALNLFVFAG